MYKMNSVPTRRFRVNGRDGLMPEHTIIVMNEYERKLLEYRATEKRKARWKRWKDIFWSSLSFFPKLFVSSRRSSRVEKISQHPNLPTIRESSSDSEWETDTASVPGSSDYDAIENRQISPTKRSRWRSVVLHSIVWCGMFGYAVHVEFGTVYLLLSAFYFMWINTRTGPKDPNEISAYSVFNPNCERIQGTLDAETLEKEMKYGFII